MAPLRLGRYRAVASWVTLLVAVVGALVAFNVWQSRFFLADAAASQTVARVRIAISRLSHAAATDTGTRRALIASIDADIGAMSGNAARSADGALRRNAYPDDAGTRGVLAAIERDWRAYRARPAMQPAADAAAALPLDGELIALDHALAAAAGFRAELFRNVQLAGLGTALAVLALLLFFVVRNLRSEDVEGARARAETGRILDTVSEGLFLLDQTNTIGAQTSRTLRRMLGREDLAGQSFDALLAGMVPEKTRRTALEYVSLLWGERVNENLVRTLNPLAEVEVRVPDGAGEPEDRHFSFEFSRVRSGGRTTQILCTVVDVSERVRLSRELAAAQTHQQGLLDLLMAILQVDPGQLATFLSSAESAMTLVNSVLKLPAREESAFREKLDRIFREVHSLKAEASALGLKSVAERAHRFEDSLADLRARPTLTGNDFLPLAVKLDDLFGHLGSVRDLVARLGELRTALTSVQGSAASPAGGANVPVADAGGTLKLPVADTLRAALAEADTHSLPDSLRRLVEKSAADLGREVSLVCVGLEDVPPAYAKPVRDILNQFVRNAVVHGIEPPEERRQADKAARGTLALEFADLGDLGFELTFQDDGRGLDHERIRATAVARGLISPDDAAGSDPRRLASYIFRPGFSTAGAVSMDAGRGVGMNLVREIVVQLGGRISLSTRPGQFTRFRVFLPALRAQVA